MNSSYNHQPASMPISTSSTFRQAEPPQQYFPQQQLQGHYNSLQRRAPVNNFDQYRPLEHRQSVDAAAALPMENLRLNPSHLSRSCSQTFQEKMAAAKGGTLTRQRTIAEVSLFLSRFRGLLLYVYLRRFAFVRLFDPRARSSRTRFSDSTRI